MAIRVLQSTVDTVLPEMKKNLQEIGTVVQEKAARQESYDEMQKLNAKNAALSDKARKFRAAVNYGQNLPEADRSGYMRELNKRAYNTPAGQMPDFADMMTGQWVPPQTTPATQAPGSVPPTTTGATPAAPQGFSVRDHMGNYTPPYTPTQNVFNARNLLDRDPTAQDPDTQHFLQQTYPGMTDLNEMIKQATGSYPPQTPSSGF